MQAQDLAVCGGQSSFELVDALSVGGALTAEGFGECVNHCAIVA